jgi:hypothetical protein
LGSNGYGILNKDIGLKIINIKNTLGELYFTTNLHFGKLKLTKKIDSDEKDFMAVASVDGLISIREIIDKDNEKEIWNLDLEQEIVKIQKYKTGTLDQLFISTWDGITYILDSNKNIVCYNFKQRISTFYVGLFSTEPNKHKSCIFYVTFNENITMFYDVEISQIQTFFLLEKLKNENKKLLDELENCNCKYIL